MTLLKPLAAFVIVAFALGGFVVLAGVLFGTDAAVTDLRNRADNEDRPNDDAPGSPLASTQVIDDGTSDSPTPSATTPTAPLPSSSPTLPPSPSPTPAPPPPPTLLVTLTDAPAAVHAYDPIRINWTLEADDGNNTTAARTGIAYAAHPVEDPVHPSDYGNLTGAREDPHVPAEFNHTFTHADAQVLYLRAYALVGATVYYWSDEVSVNVTVDIYTVAIEGDLTSASYDPDNLTIRPGDGIRWENNDTVPHTATNDSGTPEPFDTGTIDPGTTSDVLYFTSPGTYAYHCEIHPEMEARFQVEEGAP